ncbi:MAG: TolC family protein, partial [Henriciella sp.]|nr:TolC family protein [Henriciella sp.]
MNRLSAAPLAALALLLAVTACANFDRAAYEARLESLTLSLPSDWQGVGDEASRPQNWQSLFDDPLLVTYLGEAEAFNSDLEEAAARVRAAAAELLQSNTLLRPAVSAELSAAGFAGLANLDATSESYGSGLSASWAPDIFGLARARIRQSEALFRLQEANAERLRRVVLAQTARAYIQTIEADQQLILSQENLTFVAETRRVSQARFRLGDLARGEAALAELEYENAAANVASQALAARSARRGLAIRPGGD